MTMEGCYAYWRKLVAQTEMKWCCIFKGLLTRLLFIFHASLSIFLLHSAQKFEDLDTYFTIPIGALVIESVVTLYSRSGKEFKYVWLCGFFYITAIIPMIWVLELDLLATRQKLRFDPDPATLSNVTRVASESDVLFNALKLSEIDGRKFCELGGVICLIVGRWLTPRCAMSRNQLSQLLLSYAANSADILELFESFESPKIIYDTHATIAVLAAYTWALCQFALVTTATPGNATWKKRVCQRMKGHEDEESMENNGEVPHSKKNHDHHDHGPDKDPNDLEMIVISSMDENLVLDTKNDECSEIASVDKSNQAEEEIHHQEHHPRKQVEDLSLSGCCVCHPEYPQLLVTLCMQDGPFLLMRLTLTLKYDVLDELFVFFLAKNAISCILLVHRFLVLRFEKDTSMEMMSRLVRR